MEHYTYEAVNDHLYRIKDALDVAMYLVVGNQKACLIDTGYGLTGLRDLVEQITSLPVFVLLTHGHVDHAFGIYEFDDIYMNLQDMEIYNRHSDWSYREGFMRNQTEHFEELQFQPMREIDFHPVEDGQVFDLGGFHIKAFYTPGHTQGMTMYLFVEDRIMLFGDGCGPNTMIMEDCSGKIEDFYQSLCRVKENEDAYDRVIRNHGTCESPKELLDNVMGLCRKILEGKDARWLLPDPFQKMFVSTLESVPLSYSARPMEATAEGLVFADDAGEGNINYRADKAARQE
jgi:glyoxylase-like metal-dependent hydrolase (beta-lactamase superfamily II)